MILELLGEKVTFLRDGDLWRSEVTTTVFDHPLQVEIVCESERLLPEHAVMLKKALDRLESDTELIKQGLHNYFRVRQKVAQEIQDTWGDDFSGIDNADDCWQSLQEPTLYFDVEWEEEPHVLLTANCDWQCDGGLQVTLPESGVLGFPGDNQ